MNSDQWTRLADWHNTWLDASVERRVELRAALTTEHPDLVTLADQLMNDSASLAEFLETPAFVVAARRMARETTSLSPGVQVGPYRIVALIAHGGMGVVYRATDVRLQRDVALKMLAAVSVPHDVRLERFLREARLTASIDHPNVVKVYDVGLHQGSPYIVVELFEGETLRERLIRGPLPVTVARHIAIDVAKGLVAAHAAGLVHRDLKPENIFLTRGGVTKILDFGIAKLAATAAPPAVAGATTTGILVGTAGYLAPEQIRGDDVDRRADLFALGAIVFEMITGERAFPAENTVDTLHAILHAAAPALVREGEVSRELAPIVSRLLEKAPANRFQSAADLAWALELSTQAPSASLPPQSAKQSPGWFGAPWLWIAAPIALAVVGIAVWRILGASSPAPEFNTPARFSWTLPADTTMFSPPTVSPDGRRICWIGVSRSAPAQVFVRDLSSLEATAIPGTEEARHPFWSPDGESIGFFADGKLKRVAVSGGTPIVLADVEESRGGTWSPSGVIVFAPNYRDTPLMRVSDRGGPVVPVTVIERAAEEVTHRWPAFLPDGIHFVYNIVSLRDDRRGVYIGSTTDRPQPADRPLFLSESGAVYAATGDGRRGALLSVGSDRIEVRPFDPVRRSLVGDVRLLGVNASGTSPHHAALLSAGGNVLAYSAIGVPWGSRFVGMGRDGSNLVVLNDYDLGGFPRLSPDGRRLARARVDPLRGNPDIWVDDLDRGTELRLTTSADFDVMPAWSPDGQQVAYRSGAQNAPTIAIAAADGTGVKRTLSCPEPWCEPSDWSPEGELIVTVGGRDIWTVPLDTRSARPLLAEPFTERDGRVSPDGRWLAYVSDESGRPEISVRSLADPPRRYVVSSGGGDQPVWRPDGAELFFAAAEGRLYGVTARSDGAGGGLSFGPATRLNVPPLGERHWGTTYAVASDGHRLYLPLASDRMPPREFGVIMNWRALFQ
jgi:serine/threonine protein kinase/Tol biopolymer transport system component